MYEHVLLIKELTEQERMQFQMQYASSKKDLTVGVLLTLFLGWVGAHHYYLGKTGLGIVYTVFFWTLIPALIGFVELFLMSGRIRKYNQEKAQEIATSIKVLRS